MDSQGRILAQETAGSRSGSARFVGSDCRTTESPGAAAAAAKYRCKFGVAVVLRRRRAVVLGLSAIEIQFPIEGGESRSRVRSPGRRLFARVWRPVLPAPWVVARSTFLLMDYGDVRPRMTSFGRLRFRAVIENGSRRFGLSVGEQERNGGTERSV